MCNLRYSRTDESPATFLWFPAIQRVECEERLSDLTPERCFVATETIEREIRQIGEV